MDIESTLGVKVCATDSGRFQKLTLSTTNPAAMKSPAQIAKREQSGRVALGCHDNRALEANEERLQPRSLTSIVIGLWAIAQGQGEVSRVTEFNTADRSAFWSVIAARTLAFFAIIRFEDSVNMAKECKDPVRHSQRSISIYYFTDADPGKRRP